MEISVNADKVIYSRVPSIRDAVHNGLANKLIALGYDYDEIFFRTELVPDAACGCTKQITVYAYTD